MLSSPISPSAVLSKDTCPEISMNTCRLGVGFVPRALSGVQVLDNWDALGMRASGSGELLLEGCTVPARMVMLAGRLGEFAADIYPIVMTNALALAAAALGIAEEAERMTIETATTRRKAPANRPIAERIVVQELVAENEVDIAAARALLARTATTLDDYFADHGDADMSADDMALLMRNVQCANMLVKRNAIAVVDRALTVSGGSGYMSKSPLSRLYRDVRAGPFMQPFGEYEIAEYLGKSTLGITPALDR